MGVEMKLEVAAPAHLTTERKTMSRKDDEMGKLIQTMSPRLIRERRRRRRGRKRTTKGPKKKLEKTKRIRESNEGVARNERTRRKKTAKINLESTPNQTTERRSCWDGG